MFTISKKSPYGIEMVEGDYGITLPITIEPENDEQFSTEDTFAIKIYKKINDEPIINAEYTEIENNTIPFELTQQDSALLPVGMYYYDLDWFQDGNFMCNIIARESFTVLEKAGAISESEDR